MEFLKSFNAINQRNISVFNVLLMFYFSFTAFFRFLSWMCTMELKFSLSSTIVSTKIPCQMGLKNLKKLSTCSGQPKVTGKNRKFATNYLKSKNIHTTIKHNLIMLAPSNDLFSLFTGSSLPPS